MDFLDGLPLLGPGFTAAAACRQFLLDRVELPAAEADAFRVLPQLGLQFLEPGFMGLLELEYV
jgi:hypothetical protein